MPHPKTLSPLPKLVQAFSVSPSSRGCALLLAYTLVGTAVGGRGTPEAAVCGGVDGVLTYRLDHPQGFQREGWGVT